MSFGDDTFAPRAKTITEIYQEYLKNTWRVEPNLKDLAVMGMGFCGEAGEATEHFKKVVRDYNCNFQSYPVLKRQEALLEYGDALHYLAKQAQQFGFTLELIMAANMTKLDERKRRQSWKILYGAEDDTGRPD